MKNAVSREISGYKNFTFDAGAVVALGRDSIKDNTTAIVELVKNSYDADAQEVLVEISSEGDGFIRIADVGTGMTEKEIDDNWLRIGFSEKRNKKETKRQRRKSGEKGIGRLSAYRLGDRLRLVTRSESDSVLTSLQINWSEFEKPKADAEKIRIEILKNEDLVGTDLELNPNHGTELLISGLRQKWVRSDIEELYRELENLVPAFKDASDFFRIILKTDIYPDLNGKVDAPEEKIAQVELKASYDGLNEIQYKIYQPKAFTIKGKKVIKKNIAERGSLVRAQIAAFKDTSDALVSKVGPFNLTFRFYPQSSTYIDLVDIKQSVLREYLSLNSGVKVYRDGIRVKPYGDSYHPDGDWLSLEKRKGADPAGASRSTFKVANRQIVGGIFVSRDKNPGLTDSSSREGLMNNDEFHELKALANGCLTLLEGFYHKIYVKNSEKKNEANTSQNSKNNVDEVIQQVSQISNRIKALAKDAPELSDEIEDIIYKTAQIESGVRIAKKI